MRLGTLFTGMERTLSGRVFRYRPRSAIMPFPPLAAGSTKVNGTPRITSFRGKTQNSLLTMFSGESENPRLQNGARFSAVTGPTLKAEGREAVR